MLNDFKVFNWDTFPKLPLPITLRNRKSFGFALYNENLRCTDEKYNIIIMHTKCYNFTEFYKSDGKKLLYYRKLTFVLIKGI